MSLIPNQLIKMNWNNKHKMHYIKKGYSFTKNGDEFLIKAEDLAIQSKTKVNVLCDNCGRIKEMSYKAYYEQWEKLGYNNCKQHLQSYYEACFELENYTLLSDVTNAKSDLDFICDKGHDGVTSWNKFKNGTRCKTCGIENRARLTRFSYDFVKNEFAKRGYILLSNSYQNCESELEFICPNSHKQKITFSSFYYQEADCRDCRGIKTGNRDRHSYEYIQDKFRERGYILLSDTYINSSQKLVYICPEGHIGTVKYCHFNGGTGCFTCGVKNRTGESNGRWNPDKEMDERVRRRKFHEYTEFRREVFKRDDYTCQCCGNRGGDLVAHHKDGYHWCEKKRLDKNNGVTLCKDCHIDFHTIFGTKNNTKEQYETWIKEKRKKKLVIK
jgi:hypothetical protein